MTLGSDSSNNWKAKVAGNVKAAGPLSDAKILALKRIGKKLSRVGKEVGQNCNYCGHGRRGIPVLPQSGRQGSYRAFPAHCLSHN
jgi:hypothetical protein